MKEIESVSLIGLGAIGSVVAVRILGSMPQGGFSIIADSQREELIRRDGVIFNGCRYDFSFASEVVAPKDMILIATKATALHEALDAIAPYVGEHTLILSLMNGIISEAVVAERFGNERVLYSYFLGHTSTRNVHEVTHDGTYNIFFGEQDNRTHSEKVERIRRFFDRTGVPYQIPEDMISSLWQKFIINIGCNQTTALLRCSYGHLQQDPKAMALAIEMMSEAAEIAGLQGVAGADGMVSRAVEVIHSMNPQDKSSMLQDIEAGRTTEIDIFAGTLCRMATELGCTAPMIPLNRAALQTLSDF